MCQINYTTFPTCACIFLHKPPKYCPGYLALHHPGFPPFEAKLITYHPALTGLLLFRDHIRFQSHTISAVIRPEKLTCENCIAVKHKASGVGIGEEEKAGKEAGARCPLCDKNKDVIEVMEDAAAGCGKSAGKIKRRVEKDRAKGLWSCNLRERGEARQVAKERRTRIRSDEERVSEEARWWSDGGGGRRVMDEVEEAEVDGWESDWDSEEDRGSRSEEDDEEDVEGEGDEDEADEGFDVDMGEQLGKTKQKRGREDEAGVREYGKKLRTLLGDLQARGGR